MATPAAGARARNGGAGAGASGAPGYLAAGRGVGARADGGGGGSARSGTVEAGTPTAGRRARERSRGARGGATTGRATRAGTGAPGARAPAVAGRAGSSEASIRPQQGRRIEDKTPLVAQTTPGGRRVPRDLGHMVYLPGGGLEHAGPVSSALPPRHLECPLRIRWRDTGNTLVLQPDVPGTASRPIRGHP